MNPFAVVLEKYGPQLVSAYGNYLSWAAAGVGGAVAGYFGANAVQNMANSSSTSTGGISAADQMQNAVTAAPIALLASTSSKSSGGNSGKGTNNNLGGGNNGGGKWSTGLALAGAVSGGFSSYLTSRLNNDSPAEQVFNTLVGVGTGALGGYQIGFGKAGPIVGSIIVGAGSNIATQGVLDGKKNLPEVMFAGASSGLSALGIGAYSAWHTHDLAKWVGKANAEDIVTISSGLVNLGVSNLLGIVTGKVGDATSSCPLSNK